MPVAVGAEVEGVDAFGAEGAGGEGGAGAGSAVEEGLFAAEIGEDVTPFAATLAQVAEGAEVGGGGDTGTPFGGFAHVDEDGLAGGDPAGGFGDGEVAAGGGAQEEAEGEEDGEREGKEEEETHGKGGGGGRAAAGRRVAAEAASAGEFVEGVAGAPVGPAGAGGFPVAA